MEFVRTGHLFLSVSVYSYPIFSQHPPSVQGVAAQLLRLYCDKQSVESLGAQALPVDTFCSCFLGMFDKQCTKRDLEASQLVKVSIRVHTANHKMGRLKLYLCWHGCTWRRNDEKGITSGGAH